MNIELCRYSLEEGGANPVKVAHAIHEQLSGIGNQIGQDGAVPVEDIARALDIVDIRYEDLTNIEGAVLMGSNKAKGSILVNKSSKTRMRFTIAHELFHFLSPLHVPTNKAGFECSKVDLRLANVNSRKAISHHHRQEAEANTFAAELLMPFDRMNPYLLAEPNLQHVLDMASVFSVSKEAAARHYVHKYSEPIAIVFSKNNKVRYVAKSKECPWIELAPEESLPIIPNSRSAANLSDVEDLFASDWISASKDAHIQVQTLYQDTGYAMTLLIMPEEHEDLGMDDSFERFGK